MLTQLRPAWIFDGSDIPDPLGHGQRAVDFLRALRHPKSTERGKPYALPLFWERIARRIYGPRDEHGARQVRTVFILMPRGARKTTFGAGLSLLHAFGYERTPGGLCIAAAAAEDQARIAYDEAAEIVKATPWLAKAAKLTESVFSMEHPKSGTTFRAIASRGNVQLGRTPAFVLADELIAWENRRLWSALRTGLVKTPGTLLVVITQAGRGQTNLAWDIFQYARKVRDGAVIDPGFLPILFETPADADWRDEELWGLVNPGLELGFPDLGGLRQLAREAAERPADRDDFRQFHLNCWLDNAAAPFVDMSVYDEGAEPIDLAAHEEARTPCWLGVDLSSSIDLTVIVAAFATEDGFDVVPFFYCPKGNLTRREDASGAPYRQWAKERLITATPGDVVDVRAVEDQIRDLCATYNVQEVAFDPALARQSLATLHEEGLPVVEHRQGSISMMPSIAELERAVIGRRFRHAGHPVLRWTFENCEVETNAHGHKTRLTKSHRWRSIDGAVAAAMAVGRASLGDVGTFIYADAEARPDGIEVW